MPHTTHKATPTEQSILSDFAGLREHLTRLNVDLLKSGRFQRAQQVTGLLQETCKLEERVRAVVRGEENQPVEARLGLTARSGAGSTESYDPDDYPLYVRRDDMLVKIGLQRDKTATWEHKLFRADFEAIRDVLLPLAQTGERFEATEVIERVKPPSYLVYFLLALLQEMGHLVSPSRGKYRFPKPVDAAGFDEIWRQVPVEEEG